MISFLVDIFRAISLEKTEDNKYVNCSDKFSSEKADEIGLVQQRSENTMEAFAIMKSRDSGPTDWFAELVGSLKLGYVWIFFHLIPRPMGTKNQLYKNPNIA